MSISFRCPKCNKKIKVDDKYAGRGAKCPACKTSVTIPKQSLRAREEELPDVVPVDDEPEEVPPPAAPVEGTEGSPFDFDNSSSTPAAPADAFDFDEPQPLPDEDLPPSQAHPVRSPRARFRPEASLRELAKGMGMVQVGILIWGGGLGLLGLMSLMMVLGVVGRGGGALLTIMMTLVVLSAAVGAVMALWGRLPARRSPSAHDARSLGRACFVATSLCTGCYGLAALSWLLMLAGESAPQLLALGLMSGGLTWLAAELMYTIWIGQIGDVAKTGGLHQHVARFLLYVCGLVVIIVGLFLLISLVLLAVQNTESPEEIQSRIIGGDDPLSSSPVAAVSRLMIVLSVISYFGTIFGLVLYYRLVGLAKETIGGPSYSRREQLDEPEEEPHDLPETPSRPARYRRR